MSGFGTLASQEKKLKTLVTDMGRCSRRWADSQDGLQHAVDRRVKMVDLAKVLDDVQMHLAELRASIDLEDADAGIVKAENIEGIWSSAAEETALELNDHIAGMYRSRTWE